MEYSRGDNAASAYTMAGCLLALGSRDNTLWRSDP